MAGMNDEEFAKICRTKFDFGADLEACLKYYHDGEFDKYDKETGEKVNIPEDTKYLFATLKEASQTDIGAQVLNQLDDNTKITLLVDRNYNKNRGKKNGADGYHTNDHQIALTGTKGSPRLKAATMIHELTHEVQLQQGGKTFELKTSQDRVMANKMEEAEARLNTAYALKEIYPNLSFMEKLQLKATDEVWLLVLKIREAEEQNLSSDTTKKELLQTIYKDKDWSEFYDEQTSKFANYKTSISHYAFLGDVSLDDVKQSFRQRLNLSQEEIDWFLNPDNIASSPKDLKRKSTTTYALEQGNITCQDVAEDGKLIQRFLSDENGKKIKEEYFSEGSKFVKVFDPDGRVCSTSYTITGADGADWKYIKRPEDNNWLSIKINDSGGISKVSLMREGKNVISPQQSEELVEQYGFVHDTFNKMKDGKGDDTDIAFAYKFIKEDKLGLYADNPVLIKTINEEAVRRGIDKEYLNQYMRNDAEQASNKVYVYANQHNDVADTREQVAAKMPINPYNLMSGKEQTI